ncbi:MEDS domain-containing protein [Paenibacillus athensensis]|uniref:histidine kinase n=1 Tax=Paenibacillus athensensis TaxID=1967502 RepID=A0A4Y8Q2B0_9BACL|nr:ATP-binding protein [Paenibacillus athensensis]MCD1258637.1 MEDS domain-containing protein [Paenibacillus athensensis]
MAERRQISLTQRLQIKSGEHLVYFYSSMEAYIRNLASFIKVGHACKQQVIIVDNQERCAGMLERLRGQLSKEALGRVQAVDSGDRAQAADQLDKLLRTFADKRQEVRVWRHADWRKPQGRAARMHAYDCACGRILDAYGCVTVCAFDGEAAPASLQTAMMRCHEYFMTDEEIVVSGLYRTLSAPGPAIPGLAAQSELESEVDGYRQKLDFIHAVSHEVRNPLTVIKAYASLVMSKVQDAGDRDKLKAICDYVMEIDNEMTHIINTEQMLTSEALWRKKPIQPKTLLADVIGIMEVKGRTQNIRLETHVELSGAETIVGNAIGFRLTVSNLLSNAIKYSQEGGAVRLFAYTEQRQLVVVVEDDGIGMSEAQTALLFRKYEKMNEDRGGQGIGLFMVKKLVDHFRGSIGVWSRPNEGTRMTVQLPLAYAVAEHEAAEGLRPQHTAAAALLAAEALASGAADAAGLSGAGA